MNKKPLSFVSQFHEDEGNLSLCSSILGQHAKTVQLGDHMDSMEQRIAIARLCGWTETIMNNTGEIDEEGSPVPYKTWYIYHIGSFARYDFELPDYLNDPIDMIGAERLLMDGLGWLNTACYNMTPFDTRRTYIRYLGALLGFSCQTGDKSGYVPSLPKSGYDSIYRDIKRCAKAKPFQRAEAFLRALNLWKSTSCPASV